MKKYCPSNGTEGMIFMSEFCDRCFYERGEKCCSVLTATLALNVDDPGYPDEWTYDSNGNPTCTKFKRFDSDDGEGSRQPRPTPIAKNQLCMPFIIEEIQESQQSNKQLKEVI